MFLVRLDMRRAAKESSKAEPIMLERNSCVQFSPPTVYPNLATRIDFDEIWEFLRWGVACSKQLNKGSPRPLAQCMAMIIDSLKGEG